VKTEGRRRRGSRVRPWRGAPRRAQRPRSTSGGTTNPWTPKALASRRVRGSPTPLRPKGAGVGGDRACHGRAPVGGSRDEKRAGPVDEGDPRVPGVRGSPAPRAAAGPPPLLHGHAPRRRAGAGAAGARDRHPVERPVRRPTARVARPLSRGVLRRAAHRDRPDRLLLSRQRAARGPAASPRVRAALAPAPAGAHAARPARAPRGRARAGLLPRQAARALGRGDGVGGARLPARVPSPAAPEPAQPQVVHDAPVVRAAGGAARAAGRPRGPQGFSSRSKSTPERS
jgi:hypothetical protein